MTRRPDFRAVFRDWFMMIGTPGAHATRIWQTYNMHSMKDIAILAERMGCEVVYTDLPGTLSGFAQIIDGTPFIVVNRAKHPTHQQYTIAHELAHQVLHLQPQPVSTNTFQLPSEDFAEMQAHLFAATWLLHISSSQERDEILKHNREAYVIPFLLMLITIGLGLGAGLAYLITRFLPSPPSKTGEGTWTPSLPSAGSTPASPAATN